MVAQITQLADSLGAIIGFVLTVMILSYIIGDNILFRLGVSIFVGVASGYAAVLVLYNVLWYQVLVPVFQSITTGNSEGMLTYGTHVLPAVVLGIWMMTKVSPRLARGGTPVLAFLTGVGAATVIAGAVRGTVFPQIGASVNLLNAQTVPPQMNQLAGWFINGLIVLAGTVATLIYFQFGIRRQEEGVPTRRSVILDYLSAAGQIFIVLTLGVIFAGVYVAALSAMIDRLQFLWNIITSIF